MVVSSTGHRLGLLAIMLTLVLSGCQLEAAPEPDDPRRTPSAGRADPESDDPDDDTEATDPNSWSVTLAFAGDVHFEGRVAALLDSPDGTVGPMSSALRSADVAMVNLESALTSGGSRAAKELEDPTRRYWFRSPPSALGLLERSGVDVVSMANNHGADYGAAGLRDSLRRPAPARRRDRGRAQSRGGVPRIPDLRQGRRGGGARRRRLTAGEQRRDLGRRARRSRPGRGSGHQPAAGRGPGRPGPERRRRGVPALGRRGPGLPDRRPAHARSEPRRRRGRRGGRRARPRPLGAGMLGDTYVSYGLGNFLWYNGGQPDTGVLRVQIVDGEVVRDDWVPGEIRTDGRRSAPSAGRARPQRRGPGMARAARLHRPRAGAG